MHADAPENELDVLRQLVATLQAALAESQKENTLLRQKIDALVRRVFGASSERIDPAQLELLAEGHYERSSLLSEREDAIDATEIFPSSAARRNKAAIRQDLRWPKDLPLVEEVIDPEPVRSAPQEWRCIGQEVSEQLDYEPARFLRRRTIRRKYVHRHESERAPLLAPLPQRLLDRSLPAPGLLAHVLVSKYCDHLPLYRQEQIFSQRHGVHLPRQTLARWIELAAEWLRPIYEHIRTGVLAGGYERAHQSAPIIRRLQRALVRLKSSGRYLPQSLLGQAIDYALGQWSTLEIYLNDGRIEIDNNLVENAIRPTAVGKKNWLFIGEAQAGERSAIIYTVVESCRQRGLDPSAYLRDVLTRLPCMTNRQVPQIIPAAWAKTHRPMPRPAAS